MPTSLLITAGINAAAFLLIFLFRNNLNNAIYRALLAVLCSIMFTLLTIGASNNHPLLVTEEAGAIELLKPLLSDRLNDSLTSNPVILIDVTNQKQLLGSGLQGDTITRRSATDRSKLARLLNWLYQQRERVGMVVCDVIFQQTSSADTPLRTWIDSLEAVNKIQVAKSRLHPNYSLSSDSLFTLLPSSGHSVNIVKYDGLYFSHDLKDENDSTSLPYELYLWRRNLYPSALQSGLSLNFFYESNRHTIGFPEHWVINSFIPQLAISEANVTGQISTDGKTQFQELTEHFFPPRDQSQIADVTLSPIPLGLAVQPEGKSILLDLLNTYKGLKPIILIGTFTDEQQDVHQTMFGRMHGSLIVLNVYFNLLSGNHFISLGYIIYLFSFFYLIISLLFIHKLGPVEYNWLSSLSIKFKKPQNSNMVRQTFWNSVGQTLKKKGKEVFVDELHYWLLLACMVGAARWFGHLINVIVVLIFLAGCSLSLSMTKNIRFRFKSKSYINDKAEKED